jgi:hypothetical protein
MEFQTMSALVTERQATLRCEGERVRRGRFARRRRAMLRQGHRHRDRSPVDTR